MKKLLMIFIGLFFCGCAHASVGFRQDGVYKGAVTDFDMPSNSVATYDGSILTFNPAGGAVGAGLSGYLPYYYATGNNIHGQTVLYFDGTNIGIGTTSPAYLLDVNGIAHFAGNGGITLDTGGAVRTDTTASHTALLQAYNTGSVAYTTFGTLTAGASPTFDLSTSTTVGSDTIVSRTGTQTLTNKTLTTPIITSISNSGTVTVPTGTDTLVNLAGSQTLTNKTLTSPRIGTSILATDATNYFTFSTPGSAVNYLAYANAATGTDPSYTVTGDANRGITMTMAGTGGLTITSTNSGPSLINRGLTVNNDANSASTSDFTVKTADNAKGFHVIAANSHVNAVGTQPTLSSCGTSPSITGNDHAFRITVGATTNACTATFANAYTNTPTCVIKDQSDNLTNAETYTVSNTAVVISRTTLGGDIINVMCVGTD